MALSSSQIGEQIRILRRERGWTLQELSGKAGISLSALSKIETAQVAPTFDTLLKIARGLGMAFDTLLAQASGPDPEAPARAGGRLVVTKKANTVGFSTGMYDYEVHANALRRKHMTPLIMEIKARSAEEVTSWSSHEGEEFIYVLKGRVALHTEFYEAVIIEAGESAYIDSGMAHMFLNVGEGEAAMASICYSNSLDRSAFIAAGLGEDGDVLPEMVRETL
jgi:transcriptional regulator with XRE-family HTH domain